MDRVPGAVPIGEVQVERCSPGSPKGLGGEPFGQGDPADASNRRSEPVHLTSLVGVSVQEELRPDVDQRSGVRRFVGGIVLGLAILQALWIVTVPPFRASDEFDHAYRAAAVARGEWRASEAATDGRGTLVRVPADLVAAAHDQCAALPYTGHDNCNPAQRNDDGTVLVGSGAGQYNPIFYWVIGTAARPFHGAAALYAMRIASGLLCLMFMGLAAWALGMGRRGPWSGVGLLLATSPVFVFSTSVAAPNGLEMAAALALWCLLLRAPDIEDPRTQRRMLILAGVAAALVVTLRMLGPLFVVLIVLLAITFHGRAAFSFVSRHRVVTGATAAFVAVATAGAASWTLRAGLVDGAGELQGTTEWSPSSIVLWPFQTIAAFPFRNQPGPIFVYFVIGGLVCLLVFTALRTARGTRRWALATALVVALALPFVLTWISRDGRGVMWQGRYGLPLAVGFVVIAGLVLDRARRRPPAAFCSWGAERSWPALPPASSRSCGTSWVTRRPPPMAPGWPRPRGSSSSPPPPPVLLW